MFSRERANLHCEFIEGLHHVEGKWSSPTIALDPWQCFVIVPLFGFRNHDGGRRFTTALLAVARKNAKSTIAAAILLSCLCLEPEVGPQVISAATTGQQARIVWKAAKQMIEKDAELRREFQLEGFANSIARYENGGSFKPINAKASTQDGLNPSHTVCDEVHAHKNGDLINVLSSAAGARSNPLTLYTTTEGYESPGPWGELRQFACNVLDDVVTDADHFLVVYYTLDDDDDVFDERHWVKANPMLESNRLLLTETRKLATEAQQMPSKLAEFTIKRANRRSQTGRGWVNVHKWRKCNGPVVLDELVGYPCWGAFDLASTMDMNAWRLLWRKDDRWFTWGRYWVPAEAARQRAVRKTAPYEGWIKAGIIEETPGEVADQEVIKARILEDYVRFAPRKVAYDTWNAAELVRQLGESGMSEALVPFIQGPKSYHPAMQAFEREYTVGHLSHGGDPVLTWNASNLVTRPDKNGNLAPDRKKSADKIDGVVALLMAFGIAVADDLKPQTAFVEL